MNVALLLSGLPIEFEYCYYHCFLPVFIKNLEPDIYIYCRCDDETKENIENLYQPKKLVVEKRDKEENFNEFFKRKAPETNPLSTLQMFRRRYECSKLIEKDYDWIILSRFGSIIKDLIFDINFLKSKDNKLFHIPEGGDWGTEANFKGLGDHLCLSSYKNIIYYCDLYNKIKKYCINEKIVYHPEKLLGYHLKDKSVKRFFCTILSRRFENEKWNNSLYNHLNIK
jgi:hypothetical protein